VPTPAGKVVYHPSGKVEYFVHGRRVSKKQYDRRFPSKLRTGLPAAPAPGAWQDFTSLALSVHESQVAEANERNKRHGVRARYDATGLCHIPDRSDRKRLMALEGLHDNSGGYSDG
jgi:hypothetical protein